MDRKKRLRADPEKVREFLQRGRGQLSRGQGLARGEPLKRTRLSAKRGKRVVEGPLDPASWRRQVFAASGGICIVSGSRATGVDDGHFHAHHIIAAQQLRKRGLYGLVWDPRNGLWLAELPHMAHEHTGGSHRLSRDLLPAAVWDFAGELDGLAGSEWASAYLERTYPTAGISRGSSPRRT